MQDRVSNPGDVAMTTERIVTESDLNDTVITNYFLKFTQEDFRLVRQFDGCFHMLSQRTTGDKSVGFQLAERLQGMPGGINISPGMGRSKAHGLGLIGPGLVIVAVTTLQ